MPGNTNKTALIVVILLFIATATGLVLFFTNATVTTRNLSGPIGIGKPLAQDATNSNAVSPAANWPVFHGNAALTGLAGVEIPDKPEVLWTYNTEGRIPINASPIIANGVVYFGSMDNSLYALNFADGKKIWQGDTEGSIEGTPCYADGIVYVGSYDSKLYAFDAKSGKKIWEFKTGGEIKGGPNFVNGKVIVGSYDYNLYCLEAKNGTKLWEFPTSNYINGTPAVSEGQTVFGGCDGLLHILNIADGTETKSIEVGAYIAASVAIDGGVAYVGHHENVFIAADLKKGEIVWKFDSPKNEPFMSSPAVSRDFVVVGCDDKMVHCLNRKDGTPAWSFEARGKITSSPTIVNDRILVGDDRGRVYMLALKNGAKLWEYEIGASVDTSAAVSNNVFIFGAKDGSVTAFGKKK